MSLGVAQKAVSDAIYAVFNADTGAGGLVNVSSPLVTVYDSEWTGAVVYPYLVLEHIDEVPANRMGGKVGRELVVTVTVWDEQRGVGNIEAALARVDVLLDNRLTLAPTGYTTERCDLDSSEIDRNYTTTSLKRGVSRYRIQVVET